MIKLATAFGAVLLVGGLLSLPVLIPEKNVTNVSQGEAQQLVLPERPQISSDSAFKILQAVKTITLESSNTVVFRGPVTAKSVADLQIKIENLRFSLSDSEPIYLVLDTPGGSVYAGLDLIDYLKALPNKVHTITLFAASMGFQIVQNMEQRYITENGTLMSHRASGGVEGQFDGEIETNYKRVKRKVDYMDAIASKRMGMDIKDYKAMIKDEYWVSGFDSVEEKAADEKINLRCGASLKGTQILEFDTMFGKASVEFSNCPLIKAPLEVKLSREAEVNRAPAIELLNKTFRHQKRFVKDIVLKNETEKYFK